MMVPTTSCGRGKARRRANQCVYYRMSCGGEKRRKKKREPRSRRPRPVRFSTMKGKEARCRERGAARCGNYRKLISIWCNSCSAPGSHSEGPSSSCRLSTSWPSNARLAAYLSFERANEPRTRTPQITDSGLGYARASPTR